METKHTPGPWTPEFGEAYRVRAQQDGGQVAIMKNLKGRHGFAGRRNGDEVAANARLMAAAPELLEALQEAKAALEWCVEQGGGPACEHESGGVVCFCKENNAISSARAAIAKATGEA